MDEITPENICGSNYKKDYFNIMNLQKLFKEDFEVKCKRVEKTLEKKKKQ